MMKDKDCTAIMNEIATRGIELTSDENSDFWKTLKALKCLEGNTKYFCPITPFQDFIWW